ncbi:efflux RND transporter periplasmic adaptor subunit [Clostridium magnum]|uniref:Macrolide export protein MacA n=1 Tax=Clostridium magnum DSM 2767 TaxID=1121326 RepID=A0A162R8L5_9CLOT|nr:efflux RND transporter periplasmic adaptor subunit [Clostridium magnum]KZL89573.1 macrolide export protein MacA [Clostridium magnum DSM 2767]SHH72879.1 RND family efflux transporter, MFP subunit [Clostridium magnum DSM 2767]
MNKKILSVCSLFISIIILGGCGSKGDSEKSNTKSYPVKTLEVKNENYPISLEYEGITGGSEVRKLSFKSSGKISKIYVSKGQQIKKGDYLVDLDKSDLNLDMEASKAQMDSASAQYSKAVNGAEEQDINKAEIAVKNAEDNYNYYRDLYDKNAKLYQSGAISKQELEGAKLQADSYESALNSARQTLQQLQNGARKEDKQGLLAQLNAAKASYDSKVNLVQDASLTSDVDGYVVDVLCREGEMQSAGNPAVLLRSENQVVTIGLSSDDVKKVKTGTKSQVKINNDKVEGEIINIVQMSDKTSGTYSAEIKLLNPIDNSTFYIGDTVKVYVSVGDKNSIWIPISSILNDGEDYVYIVENGHATRKNVTLGATNEGKVAVEGLKPNDNLIIEGMKNIKAGYGVTIK